MSKTLAPNSILNLSNLKEKVLRNDKMLTKVKKNSAELKSCADRAYNY